MDCGSLLPLSRPQPQTQARDVDGPGRDEVDIDALAAEIAARVLETIAVERERNEEASAWH